MTELLELLKRLAARQLLNHLITSGLPPELQTVYRAHYSMETAVLKVPGDTKNKKGKLCHSDTTDLTFPLLIAWFAYLRYGI